MVPYKQEDKLFLAVHPRHVAPTNRVDISLARTDKTTDSGGCCQSAPDWDGHWRHKFWHSWPIHHLDLAYPTCRVWAMARARLDWECCLFHFGSPLTRSPSEECVRAWSLLSGLRFYGSNQVEKETTLIIMTLTLMTSLYGQLHWFHVDNILIMFMMCGGSVATRYTIPTLNMIHCHCHKPVCHLKLSCF